MIAWLDKTTGFPVGVSQDHPLPVSAGTALEPNGTTADQRLTVDGTTGGKQFAALTAGTTCVLWTAEDAPMRFTLDGSAPTTTNGHLVAPGDSGVWAAPMATASKWIRTTGTSGVLHLSELR